MIGLYIYPQQGNIKQRQWITIYSYHGSTFIDAFLLVFVAW